MCLNLTYSAQYYVVIYREANIGTPQVDNPDSPQLSVRG